MRVSLQNKFEPYRSLDEFSLFDLELVRIILRGGNVLDWHRINLKKSEIQALLRAHCIDLSDPEDDLFVRRIRDEAVIYLEKYWVSLFLNV